MSDQGEFLSGLLNSGANGYGSASARLLLERSPETEQRFGRQAFRTWSEHLAQRSRELAAAILVDEPDLFLAEIDWSRTTFRERGVPEADLLASLQCLRDTLFEELPEEVREAADRRLASAIERLSEPAPESGPTLGDDSPENRLALGYIEAALRGRRREAISMVLKAVDDGLDVTRAQDKVLHNAQIHIGELWHGSRLSVAQEHLVTAITEATMTLLAHRTNPRGNRGLTVLVSPAPGNVHLLGATAVAHRFELAGWNSLYLGAEIPAAELATALEDFDVQLLALSVALSTQLAGTIEAIRAARDLRPGVKILVGGRVFNAVPRLWEKVDADATAVDAAGALDVAQTLFAP